MSEKAKDSGTVEETEIVDFSRIAGDWEGEAMEERGNRFWIKITLNSSSERGARIGTVRYGYTGSDEVECEGTLEAIRANDPIYIVRERNPEENPCPNGSIRLESDSQPGRMSYEFTPYDGVAGSYATGTITHIQE